jgi:hypothetical protein
MRMALSPRGKRSQQERCSLLTVHRLCWGECLHDLSIWPILARPLRDEVPQSAIFTFANACDAHTDHTREPHQPSLALFESRRVSWSAIGNDE